MTLFVWILRIVLAFLYLAGGGYKAFNYPALLAGPVAFPPAAWIALGVFEMVGGVLLIAPAAVRWQVALTPIAATALAVETLLLAAVYASYSLKITAENPMPWALVMGLLVSVVAWRTWSLYRGV